MSTLPAQIVLRVLLPSVLGGALAWGTWSGAGLSPPGAVRGVTLRKENPDKGAGKASAPAFSPDSPLADLQRFCERLQGATMEQMQELLEEAQAFADAYRRRSAREIVLEQMARVDPLAAWAFIEKWAGGGYQNHFLSAWARVDAAGAMFWAEGQGEAGAKYIQGIVDGLVPDHLEAFLTILPRLKPEQINDSQLETAFLLLASGDSARAMQLFEGIAPGKQQNAAASAMAEGWARRDATAAYAWARAIADPAQRESALRGVFRAWAETDPQGVAAKLDELSKDSKLEDASGESPVRAVVRAWAAQDPKAAAAWLRGRSGDGDDANFKQLFNSEILPCRTEWAAVDLAEMLRKPDDKLVTEQKLNPYNSAQSRGMDDGRGYQTFGSFGAENSPLRENATPSEINQSLRFPDPAKAFDDLSQLPADASRQQVLEEVASQWVAKDPKAALAKLQQTSDEWLKLGLINALSIKASRTSDPALAAEVAKAFPGDSGRGDGVVRGVYSSIAKREPERALALLESDINAAGKKEIAWTLARQQASYDPTGAIAWAVSQKDESLQMAATESAVGAWAQSDAYAASEWLTAQPAGPVREAAVSALVGYLMQTTPDDALPWALSIADPQKRQEAQINIIGNVMCRDFQKATQMSANLQLSDENQKRISEMLQSFQNRGN